MHHIDFKTLPTVVILVGHYGAGKTTFALNLARRASQWGRNVTLADVDVVNPYFRSSDYRTILEDAQVRLIAPEFAGTSLDTPSISGAVEAAIRASQANLSSLLIIDAGGEDAGAMVVGRLARDVAQARFALWYVVNERRELSCQETCELLLPIEEAARLKATGIINNTHLAQETTDEILLHGYDFAVQVSQQLKLPLVATTYPLTGALVSDSEVFAHNLVKSRNVAPEKLFGVRTFVQTPWNIAG